MTRRVSALESEHRALGAGLDDWNGMDVAWSYATSTEDEHDAVREAAGLFDVSGLKKIWITGPDALAVVDRIATRDMTKIGKGRSAYCPVLTDAGTICDDTIIFHVDDNKYLFVHGAGQSATRLEEAGRGRNADIRFDDALHDISLQGQKALGLLDAHTPVDLDKLDYFHQVETTLFGRSAILSRTGYSGERGYEIFTDQSDVGHLWQSILDAGQSDGVMACSFNCLDKIRIEAALLFYPYDMSEVNTPWEVGLNWSISRKKPDFMGREALFAAEGKEKVKFAGVSCTSTTEVLEAGAKLLLDGEAVGVVNSPAYSHRMKKSLALVHLRPDVAVGTVLQLAGDQQSHDVTVEPVPFFDPKKTRTHS
ncbi:aminomethyltransferase family protein [Aurantimonas sp. C2-6-R+9]|uniref:aminomethyltransferase family protein n=1 Tax=unclassified Aurantimonas TaxID=2638230 RepID=UPI002E19CDEF|nr:MULTISPECIES: aminomethyltransferase family protein [unclassified Aurantimonas]MEC5292372.1 aminomethyltransferase family protein [Aurantimonas sp. C2-3-R2]MEC5322219.1 aminomethyltransferase family protein [Aurantimonas sp. A3-2-R12]MEC5382525.1 aminomethyltransferase family protein [Aurantimonas sp. C2-6-R+9]MEC5411843.1 aminomethyltransferase family protein [Aurantimonas sp. C2-4-R8]